MKRFVKGILSACLVLMVVVLPLVFAGCSKNYTINIVIDGVGTVIKKGQDNISVVGKNAVKGEENFEFRIEPGEGKEIVKVEIDGEEYTESYSPEGFYYSFKEVKKNHTVKITFATKRFDVTFMCLDANNNFVEYEALKTSVTYKGTINLNEAKYGGQDNELWFVKSGNNEVSIKSANNNVFVVRAKATLYCRKTAAELDALLAA